ncbi:Aste57867_19938 [Aphanomyces stellatus]|uniref:Aste57867_19938 protein n=1 Tax=Aphanomyces stellatus TaxID=120398 RepID=A0A485LIF6_9STRA|nr:hypothetical protein As57867_019872 [Aphanomyces stellatus]VFT96635.1 Aste57867_19938 [Aphanomyces stellatus]
MQRSRVAPVVELMQTEVPMENHIVLYRVLGFFYVLATAAGSIIYLILLAPSIANDHLWPHMNTTGIQTFLGDLYNIKLATGANGPLDLFASSAVIHKDFSATTSFIDMRPAAARAVLLSRLPLHEAIQVMRAVPFSENIQTLSLPCWADLNRVYEMAHSDRHQALCNSRRPQNAAFYLEALLRNLSPTDLATSTYLSAIQTSIFAFIQTQPGGPAWVQTLMAPRWLAIFDEVTLWQSHGLEYFQNSFQDYYLEGTQESIKIINALGMRQSITISRFTATNRPKTQWSSAFAYPGFWNDIDACAWLEASAIRAAPNNFESQFGAGGKSWDYYYVGSLGTEATAIIRTRLGPLTLIDVFLIPPPASLLSLVATHLDLLKSTLQTHGRDYTAIVEHEIDATPPAWMLPGAVYYGGNPLCAFGRAKPYVQTSFGYYDDCGAQTQHTIQLTRDSVLFAIMATDIPPAALPSICAVSSQPVFCMQTLTAAVTVLHSLLNTTLLSVPLKRATADVLALNTSFVQWATVNGTHLTLHQPMVSETWHPWSFIGWMTMFEWVMGQREVFRFEGDFSIWTLMSCHQDFVPMAASAAELPQKACQYLWIVSIYISSVVVSVLLLVLVYGSLVARFDVDGRNLLFCNRLVGGSWVGRPFLFVRGMTAVFVLSTSPVVFNNYAGLAKLDFTPRPPLHTLLLAGEVAWVTYVLNDIFLPVTKAHSTVYAPASSILTWFIALTIEFANPYKAEATIGRECTILSFTRGLECTNGIVYIGTLNRVAVLSWVAVATVPFTYLVVRLSKPKQHQVIVMTGPPEIVNFHLTSSSEAFLLSPPNKLDIAACIMSGLLPFGKYLFDVKNWLIFVTPRIGQSIYVLPAAVIEFRPAPPVFTSAQPALPPGPHAEHRTPSKLRWMGIVGLCYMCGAVVSSFVYLFASQSYFTNDFLWLGFSDTNTQAFLVNWFNVQLQVANNSTSEFQIDQPAFGDYATTNNVTQYNVFSSGLYATRIQDEANSLTNVVQGLRAMDSCKLPWIATAYCFADFSQTWQMAFSAERQQRCIQHEGDNGAVYLEAMLRNANWPALSVCWGSALETAIFSAIQKSVGGVTWTAAMKSANGLSIDAEVLVWQSKGIVRYTTMWQNYKFMGVTESFHISNYANEEYPLTLKKTNSSFHVSGATAYKMYSPLANYLTGFVTNHSSVLSGGCLIRAAPNFAFANASAQDGLLADGILTAPFDPAYLMMVDAIGPFGVVDIKRVAVPQDLRNLYLAMRMFLLSKLSVEGSRIQGDFWTVYTLHFLRPQPVAWDPPALMWGGDIFCGLNFGGNTTFPFEFFSSSGLCGNYFWDYMKPYTQNLWMAILAMGSQTPLNATQVSLRDASHERDVVSSINNALSLMHQYMSARERAQFDTAAADTKATIRDIVNLQLIQYLSFDGATYFFSRVNVFAPSEPDFEFFAWLYLFEWVEGTREVISLQGSFDTLTTMSTTKPLVQELTDAIEIPLNVGRFFYAIIFYITTVLFGVGCVVTMYIIASHGYVDGINVIAFNYVAGHVWIGRPLMLLRSLTSIALLSTSQLQLVAPMARLTSYFQSPSRDVLTTLVSSGEICWLVYILVDTCSIVTGEYTAFYSTPSVVVVSVSVAIWSFASPTTHSVALSRKCTVVAVDFDVSCVSGVIRIGSLTRFGGLIGVACGGCLASFLAVRVCIKHPPRLPTLSPLLYSAAKTEFEHTTLANWEYNGIYYLDKASAAMTGILTFTFQGTLYLADIKTWRVYEMPSKTMKGRLSKRAPTHIRFALPLESSDLDC